MFKFILWFRRIELMFATWLISILLALWSRVFVSTRLWLTFILRLLVLIKWFCQDCSGFIGWGLIAVVELGRCCALNVDVTLADFWLPLQLPLWMWRLIIERKKLAIVAECCLAFCCCPWDRLGWWTTGISTNTWAVLKLFDIVIWIEGQLFDCHKDWGSGIPLSTVLESLAFSPLYIKICGSTTGSASTSL